MQSGHRDLTTAVVTAGASVTTLGIIRGFGRRGIPVIYLDSKLGSMARYSKYITKHLKCPSVRESETDFINVLLDFGKKTDGRAVIIPAEDRQVLALSKYRKELEQFYLLPVPSYELAQKIINKRNFYKLLAEMQIPHPKTYLPEDITELRLMGREIGYPYIIKPAYSSPFAEEFHRKCFVVNSSQELERAVERLEGKNLELVIQEIIPGRELYLFLAYFNKKSEPLAICGLDKIRQYPPDFGVGSFCKSNRRPDVEEQVISLFKAIGYCGLASPELKKDPRDGKYKLIEINARTIMQNRLAAACGVDIEYVAYLDAIGQPARDAVPQDNSIFWVDDFTDFFSSLIHLKRKEVTIGELVKSLRTRRVHSVAAWDDPSPLITHTISASFGALCILFTEPSRVLEKSNV
ncbi:MAG: ATP-grasp domain-containing protein [Dehalococcoidia bacterium]|nr:MAG: ATP-grasp domain-containing protein [Dehalococcoidia bacterium]